MQAVWLLEGRRRERMTNMFRALELTMKAEASTRKALKNCMFGRGICLILGEVEYLDRLKSWC